MGKNTIEKVMKEVDQTKEILKQDIELTLSRQKKLETLRDKTSQLKDEAAHFTYQSEKIKKTYSYKAMIFFTLSGMLVGMIGASFYPLGLYPLLTGSLLGGLSGLMLNKFWNQIMLFFLTLKWKIKPIERKTYSTHFEKHPAQRLHCSFLPTFLKQYTLANKPTEKHLPAEEIDIKKSKTPAPSTNSFS